MSEPTWLAEVQALADSQHGVITRAQALALGMSQDQWQATRAGGRLSPVLTGVAGWNPDGSPLSIGPLQKAQAALLAVGEPTARLCLGSVLRCHGIAGTPWQDREHVLVDHGGAHRRRDVARHHFAVDPGDLEARWGLNVTTLDRTLLDAVRTYDRLHAVSVLDSASHVGKAPDLEALAARTSRLRRGWFDLSDPSCESPLETRTRLLFMDHGLPYRSQVAIQLPSYGAARVDFLVGERLVVECDGTEVHDTPNARFSDRAREDALRSLGYEVLRVTWSDVVHRKAKTIARIRAALRRAA